MKKLFFALFAVVLFLSCEQPESVIEYVEVPVVEEPGPEPVVEVPDSDPVVVEEPTPTEEDPAPVIEEPPVVVTPEPVVAGKFYVKNSNWETVDKGDLLSERSARSTGNDVPGVNYLFR